jgi:HSP20 family protein
MAELKEAPKPKTGNGSAQPKEIAPREMAAPMKLSTSPFAYMRRFAEEMDHLFEHFGLQTGWRMPGFLTQGRELLRREAGFVPGEWSPQVDVLHREGQFMVRADLPGLTKEDVKVEVTDDAVTIQGERTHHKKEEAEGYYYSERSYGSFYRAIPLPEGADASKATAEFRNGVLEVTMPAPAQGTKKARRLEVREGK